MKRYIFLTVILLSFVGAYAQSISVKSFQALPFDMTSLSLDGKRIDQNGEVAALIKVVTTETGFTFEGGALGIVDTKQRNGEIWVWVPRASRKITILHQKLGVLRDYQFPVSIEAERTYEMVILTSEVEPDFGWIEVAETDVLRDADVFVDGKYIGKVPLKRLVSSGKHEVNITKDPYDDYTCAIQVQKNDATLLAPAMKTNTKGEKTFTVNDVSFTMKKVEGGTFAMGLQDKDPNGLNYYYDDVISYEGELDGSYPVHVVELSTYYMGETEVTQGLWEAVTGKSLIYYASEAQKKNSMPDTYGYGRDYPMYYVSYDDVVNEFIPQLNRLTGCTFRLPTEAEWEYAAWGGNKTHGNIISGGSLDEAAWYSLNSGDGYDEVFNAINGKSHPVGLKKPNELGLYDMTGNVSEWCHDWFNSYTESFQKNPQGPSTGTSRVVRGGFWQYDGMSWNIEMSWNITKRHIGTPNERSRNIGFRLVCNGN